MPRTSRFCAAGRVPGKPPRPCRGPAGPATPVPAAHGTGDHRPEASRAEAPGELVALALWLAAVSSPVEPPPELEARVLGAVRRAAGRERGVSARPRRRCLAARRPRRT